ncbi:radical SAM protein [Pseudomonas sp. RHF3.3-3]|uniref:Radical SAM superfamily enzyme n=1 Tax=Pseudomonas asplenii TaxID=53407 RepID=A0A0N0VK86_9PSED|nr:radical SAM protein [Pseudomonas fuscovaginae]KPA92137.1 radical SAM superfamily enzyme [Pseudomonas fuscovaginae]
MSHAEPVNFLGHRQLLGNDLVINEDSCNLGCAYCLTGQSNMKSSHEGKLIFQPPVHDVYGEESDLGQRLHAVVERVNQSFRPPLLKLTGGEIFIIKDIMTFIERMSPLHEVLVVQTNGLPLTEVKVRRLAELGNVVVQISLDSSNADGNSYRVQSPRIHQMIMDRIEMVLRAGLPLEIYGVLNDRSAPYLREFVEWCARFPDNPPQLFPFPVRGPDSEAFKVRPEQHVHIDQLLELRDRYPEILPPKAYLERLSSFYRDGRRSWRCHLPRLVLSTFSDGVATPCPNIWFHNMGNLVSGDWQKALAPVNRSPFYQLLLAERPRLDACKGCFTPWDTLSLYFEDAISLDELCRAPSYAPQVIRTLLERAREDYRRGA